MDETEAFVFEIRFLTKDYIPSGFLIEVMAAVNEALLEVEMLDLKIFREEFNEIPEHIYDFVANRLLRYSGNILQIKEARNGSIILGGVAVGLCIWLLNQTLGETLKQAWLESDLHETIKNALTKRSVDKRKDIEKIVVSKFENKGINATIEIKAMKITLIVPFDSEKDKVAKALIIDEEFKKR